MLTNMTTTEQSSSLNSSINSVGDRSKDAIVRINELIRQSSLQQFDEEPVVEEKRRKSAEFSPIEYYINETNKLTSNLDSSVPSQSTDSIENNQPETSSNTQSEQTTPAKKILKRSKSESSHDPRSTDQSNKLPRRRFFSRRQSKLKKQTALDDSTANTTSERETSEIDTSKKDTSKTIIERTQRVLPPPPAYEPSANKENPTVTWKSEDEFYSPKNDFNPNDLEQGKNENEDDDDDDDDEEMSVPLLVTVFVIPLYLTLGAILFNIWENWGFINSFYFCFITLTTIGFGDFVPGSALNAKAEKEKLISAALYILLGLVLIAMCIN